jgi:integral membrane sensor domain MASE1
MGSETNDSSPRSDRTPDNNLSVRSRLPRLFLATVIVAAAYFVTGKLGLKLADINPSASPVWAPTGIAIAALLIAGLELWPAILLGAFLVNITTAGTIGTSFGIAVGNTLEAVAGAYLVLRFAHGRKAFERAEDVFKFAVFAALGCTTVSATIGMLSLRAGGFV